MKMVVINGVRYDPKDADKLGIKGTRTEIEVKDAAERDRVSAAYGAEVDGEGLVVSLENSNAGNKTEAEKDVASKPRRSGGTDKAPSK